jgi:hypothetical protein
MPRITLLCTFCQAEYVSKFTYSARFFEGLRVYLINDVVCNSVREFGYNYTGNGNTLPYKVLYGSLSGSATTKVALTSTGESAAIAGWTTF